MKFKLTVPEGTTLHRHLSGMDPRARNFELLTLAAMGLHHNDADGRKEMPVQKKMEDAANRKVNMEPIFQYDDLMSIGN